CVPSTVSPDPSSPLCPYPTLFRSIPIAAENKRKLRGFIHDESATGQTVYMEPEEALDINNAIRDLEYMERREIIKILTQLTDKIRPAIPALRKATNFLGLMDFIRAKAKLAQDRKSTRLNS